MIFSKGSPGNYGMGRDFGKTTSEPLVFVCSCPYLPSEERRFSLRADSREPSAEDQSQEPIFLEPLCPRW